MSASVATTATASARDRILNAATALLEHGGPGAVSTRTVCEAAGVQPPAIYRLFKNKEGLLDAVATKGFLDHQASYGRMVLSDDPVADLRAGWDQHVAFGLANPHLYSIMYGQAAPAGRSVAAVTANDQLSRLVHRVARAGRLRVGEDYARFALNAAGAGTTLTLIALPEDERDLAFAQRVRDDVMHSLTRQKAPTAATGMVAAAAELDALVDDSPTLIPEERALLHTWLRRLTTPPRTGPDIAEPAAGS